MNNKLKSQNSRLLTVIEQAHTMTLCAFELQPAACFERHSAWIPKRIKALHFSHELNRNFSALLHNLHFLLALGDV
jgi:hypothetical protein